MPSSFEFLPGLFRFKGYCEQKASEAAEHDRRSKQGKAMPALRSDPFAGCYAGPIENIKPGDILHSTRFEEYRTFMKTKHNMQSVKLWGNAESWRDNGQRPFAKSLSAKQEEPNPFEK